MGSKCAVVSLHSFREKKPYLRDFLASLQKCGREKNAALMQVERLAATSDGTAHWFKPAKLLWQFFIFCAECFPAGALTWPVFLRCHVRRPRRHSAVQSSAPFSHHWLKRALLWQTPLSSLHFSSTLCLGVCFFAATLFFKWFLSSRFFITVQEEDGSRTKICERSIITLKCVAHQACWFFFSFCIQKLLIVFVLSCCVHLSLLKSLRPTVVCDWLPL